MTVYEQELTATSIAAEPAVTLVVGYLNRAVGLLEQGYASRAAIDTAMSLGCGLPAGPFGQLEALGPDRAVRILESAGIEPEPALRRMIRGAVLPGPVPDSDTLPGTARQVGRVGVVGSGVMARGIAQVAVTHGLHTCLVARTGERAGAAGRAVTSAMDKAVTRGKLPAGTPTVARRLLRTSTTVDDLHDCDLVIEAVAEDNLVKRAVFAALDQACPEHAILATTTSSLEVAGCAAATRRPASVVGMHFFNPAPAMRLTEIARTAATGDDVVATVHALARSLGKVPVVCRDRTGFLVNYLLLPYLNDAIGMVDRGIAGVADLDRAVPAVHGYPMGPFTLLDTIGLDVCLAILRRLYGRFGEPRMAPAGTLVRLVEAGHLGRKSGRGFRAWDAA